MNGPFVSESLGRQHDLTRFDCGQNVLNEWLREHGLNVQGNRTGRTFVWNTDGVVVAYYTLAAHRVARDQLLARLARGSPDQIPAILLARLALDVSLHGQGLGGRILGEACYRAAVAAQSVGARMLVVDALDEKAATFYEAFQFTRLPGSLRLARKMSSVVDDLENT